MFFYFALHLFWLPKFNEPICNSREASVKPVSIWVDFLFHCLNVRAKLRIRINLKKSIELKWNKIND